MSDLPRDHVYVEIEAERLRQERKCAEKRAEGLEWLTCADPRMDDGDKLAVLLEEVGEVARELCDARAEKRPLGPNTRVELIQVAAIAVAWVEAYDVREALAYIRNGDRLAA